MCCYRMPDLPWQYIYRQEEARHSYWEPQEPGNPGTPGPREHLEHQLEHYTQARPWRANRTRKRCDFDCCPHISWTDAGTLLSVGYVIVPLDFWTGINQKPPFARGILFCCSAEICYIVSCSSYSSTYYWSMYNQILPLRCQHTLWEHQNIAISMDI